MPKDNGPRISVNKLAEYIEAKGKRQREILRDQKYPDFKGMYYREATDAISQCLASNLEDTGVITRAIRLLNQKASDKAGTMRRINSNIDALESFESMLDVIDLQNGAPELGAHTADKVVFYGVEISVRPEIVLRGKGKSGKPLTGGVKLYFSKTYPLSDDGAGYISAVLQRYAEDHLLGNDDMVGAPYCFVIDIGSKRVHTGVKSTISRLRDIEAECRNIADIWPAITPDD